MEFFSIMSKIHESEYPIIGSPIFFLLEAVSWLISFFLLTVTVLFIAYQLAALFVPYWYASVTGDSTYKFPEYFYRVYGDDARHLNTEHYGYLFSANLIAYLAATFVVPDHPFNQANLKQFRSQTSEIITDLKSMAGVRTTNEAKKNE